MKVSDLTDEDYSCLENHFGLRAEPGWLRDNLLLTHESFIMALEVPFNRIPVLLDKHFSTIEYTIYKFRLEKGI